MNPTGCLHDEQWQICDRCGVYYPISQMTTQLGLYVCTKNCVDNLDVLRRGRVMAEKMAINAELESTDRRFLARAISAGDIEEETY